jgi:hypothetical protein
MLGCETEAFLELIRIVAYSFVWSIMRGTWFIGEEKDGLVMEGEGWKNAVLYASN